MAKQTFTTGQVLTAAQMTALQQTAMLGGDANARTASYVLVAGDAGNAITMSSTSATTITVNTGIFAAGDIVTIVNINSGVCTITAGTATVTTSGSLALAQNQGGVLRFTSASAAIFLQFATPASGDIEGITTGANSGLTGGVTSGTADLKLNFTAKGQLAVGSGSGTTGFLTVGANGTTIVADSAETLGVKWQALPDTMTLLSTTTLSGSSVSITGISSAYKTLIAYIYGVTNATANGVFRVAPNNNTSGSSYVSIDSAGASFVNSVNRVTQINFGTTAYLRTSSNNAATLIIDNYANSTNYKPFTFYGFAEETGGSVMSFHGGGAFVSNTAISSLVFQNSQGNLSTGTVLLYGVK